MSILSNRRPATPSGTVPGRSSVAVHETGQLQVQGRVWNLGGPGRPADLRHRILSMAVAAISLGGRKG